MAGEALGNWPTLNADVIENLQVKHLFLKEGNIGKGQLIEALEEVDEEDLSMAREQFCRHAVCRLERVLEKKGINEKPNLQMKKRQPRRDAKGSHQLRVDIVTLYEYATALVDTFPKDVLNQSCIGRYVQLHQNATEITEPPTVQSSFTYHGDR